MDAMSGAATGNLLNAIEIDDDAKEVENLIIIAGQNDVSKPVPPEEFLWTLKKKEERLKELATVKKIALLAPPTQSPNFLPVEEKVKQLLFTENLLKIQEENGNITVWDNPCTQYESEDGRHPTVDQTLEIANFLNGKTKEYFETPYILSTADQKNVTSSIMYSKVNSLYKYGCAACNRKERNKWFFLCDLCKEEAKTDSWVHDMQKQFDELMTQIEQAENPMLPRDSDEEPASCELCQVQLGTAAEIRTHYDQKHPGIQPPPTGEDIREKSKSRKHDGNPEKRNRRKQSAPEKSLGSL